MVKLIRKGSVSIGRDQNWADRPWVNECVVRGCEKIAENTNGSSPVRASRTLGVLAGAADDCGDVWPCDGYPKETTNQGQVRTGSNVQWLRVRTEGGTKTAMDRGRAIDFGSR